MTNSPVPPEKLSARTLSPAVRFLVIALSVLGLLQGGLLLVAGRGVPRIVGVALAIPGVAVPIQILAVLASLIVVNFGVHLVDMTPPFPFRLAHVAILAAYGAIALASLAASILRVRLARALVVTFSLALALMASEAVSEQLAPVEVAGQVESIGALQQHPMLGTVNPPNGVVRAIYPDNPRGYFEQSSLPAPSTYSVSFQFNALGCRGRDYPIPAPAARHRILVLGGAQTLGVGVHERDTFAARLERSLNASVEGSASEGYDVINCGVSGYGTREERLLYELIGDRYRPEVVILSMADDDNISRRDKLALGYVHETGKYELLLLTDHLLRNARHEWRAPAPDYSQTTEELIKLSEAIRARHTRLGVVIFRIHPRVPPWSDLVAAVSAKLGGTDVPFLDLGPALLQDLAPADLVVHRIDSHPNETAHRIAADEIERFLKKSGLIAD